MTSWSHDFTHCEVFRGIIEEGIGGFLLDLQTMAAIGLASMVRFPRTVFVVVKPKPLTALLVECGS